MSGLSFFASIWTKKILEEKSSRGKKFDFFGSNFPPLPNLGPKIFLLHPKNFRSKKIFGPKNKCKVQKNFLSKKNFGLEKILGPKRFVGPKKIFY